ncbi:hypothetical protein [Bacillus pumilus]|uniref:hypothetical protein n=1 Tax=Bacillus pumilus TaxID=1408 RepID=UPI0011A8EA4D|nr:hypothetical protein [Bacillus pumilus]MBU8728292.1 hypothetical protein [Bacillus pumilus]
MNSELWELVKENIAVVAAGLSLITAVLSATIAYFYNIKHKDLDRFYKNAQENMETLIEPIYFKLKDIEAIVDKKRKIELLKEFFNTFNSNKINISRLGNRKLIDNFLKSEFAFKKILIDDNEALYQEVIVNTKQLKHIVEEDYWKLFEVIYKDYNWYKKTVDMNYILRFLLKLSFFIERTIYGVVCLSWFAVMVFAILGITTFGKLHEFLISLGICISAILLYFTFSTYNTAFVDTKQKKTNMDFFRENIVSLIVFIFKFLKYPAELIWESLKFIGKKLKRNIVSIASVFSNDQRNS